MIASFARACVAIPLHTNILHAVALSSSVLGVEKGSTRDTLSDSAIGFCSGAMKCGLPRFEVNYLLLLIMPYQCNVNFHGGLYGQASTDQNRIKQYRISREYSETV